ncbi:MAG: RNA polymerase sigma factor [Phycisphaerae bacterium]|nr:MAG: sigma-70 family RNA polymerase sigma factor [Planctomycetia bacterium]GJQ26014.1 MAG: RNA polymerase sigma factor [Phycisphaerae bacterium]
MDDASLRQAIELAKRGDAPAMHRLVDLFAGRIFGFFYRSTGSRADAEDLTQEVFVRVVRMLAYYEDDGRFESWLFRIAANLVRDRVRQQRRRPRQLSGHGTDSTGCGSESPVLDELAGEEPAADARMALGEEVDALNAALAQLPDGEREVIMLRHFSQMSFKEIAEATGTPLGTALARGHRGLRRLRELMESRESNRFARQSGGKLSV